MAARKSSARRPAKRAPARKTNSRPRYKARAKPKYAANRHHHKKPTGFAMNRRRPNRRPKANPAHRTRRRRHNPPLTGLAEIALAVTAGMALTDFAQGFVPSSLQIGGAIGKIGIRLGLSYLLGMAAQKAGFAKWATYLAAGGAAGAAQDALRLMVGTGGMLFPQAPTVVQAAGAPSAGTQMMVPASMTGEGGGDGMGMVVLQDPRNFAGLGDMGMVVLQDPRNYAWQ